MSNRSLVSRSPALRESAPHSGGFARAGVQCESKAPECGALQTLRATRCGRGGCDGSETVDFLVVGGGVVGISIARELKAAVWGRAGRAGRERAECGLHASGEQRKSFTPILLCGGYSEGKIHPGRQPATFRILPGKRNPREPLRENWWCP